MRISVKNQFPNKPASFYNQCYNEIIFHLFLSVKSCHVVCFTRHHHHPCLEYLVNYHAVSVMYPQTTCLCGRAAQRKTTYTGARGEFSSTLLYLLLKREKRGETHDVSNRERPYRGEGIIRLFLKGRSSVEGNCSSSSSTWRHLDSSLRLHSFGLPDVVLLCAIELRWGE